MSNEARLPVAYVCYVIMALEEGERAATDKRTFNATDLYTQDPSISF